MVNDVWLFPLYWLSATVYASTKDNWYNYHLTTTDKLSRTQRKYCMNNWTMNMNEYSTSTKHSLYVRTSRVCFDYCRRDQLSSNPEPDSMAYNSLSRSVSSSLNSGNLSRFIQVLAVGSRSASLPAWCTQKLGWRFCTLIHRNNRTYINEEESKWWMTIKRNKIVFLPIKL